MDTGFWCGNLLGNIPVEEQKETHGKYYNGSHEFKL
jgi:hypothetical protein